jgi:predicted DNA-binding transcriptional regulator AlpA
MSNSPILKGWDEIAAFVKFNKETVWKMVKEDGLPVFKTKAGSVMASKNAIEAWIIENGNGRNIKK